jgi:hypothetical protein
MRRSTSSTSISSQTSSTSTFAPKNAKLPRTSSITRVHAHAHVHDLFAEVMKEIGVESMTQTPAYMSGICYASYGSLDSLDTQVFPEDLLRDDVANYAACIACPPEDPEVESRKVEIVIRLRRIRRVFNLQDLVE